MTDHPSTAVERHEPRAQAPAILDERAQASLRFRARSLAALDSRISKIDDPAEREKMAVGLAITLDSLGLSIDPIQARKLHLIGGDWTPSAQLMVELVQRRGHDIVPVEMNRERAVFRGRRFGKGEPITVEYSIDDARESGALDEWVEEWSESSRGKRFLAGRHVIAVDGVPTVGEIPDWAKKLIAEGKVKRNDAWFKFRIDMLANRCVKRLTKWMAADALNGYGPVVEAEPGWDEDVVTDAELVDEDVITGDPPADDDITDAEVVDTPTTSTAPADEEGDDRFEIAKPRRNTVSDEWVADVVARCDEAAVDGTTGAQLAQALVRYVTKNEYSELVDVHRGTQQTALKDRFLEYVDGRWTVAVDGDVATLTEAGRE